MPRPRRRRRRTWRLRAALVAAALVAGCTGGDDRNGEDAAEERSTTTTTVAALSCPGGATVPDVPPVATPPAIEASGSGPEPGGDGLDIGTLLPITGDLAFLAPAVIAGVELAVADIDAAGGVLGAPLGLRHGDSAEGAAGVVESEAARLLDAGVDVLVGPLAAASVAAVLPQVAPADAALITPAGSSSGLDAIDRDDRLVRLAPTEQLQGRALAELVLADGHRTVAIAARADAYGQAIADALATRLAEAGSEVTARDDYDPAAADLGGSVVEELGTGADAVVLVGLAETALVLDALVAAGRGPRDLAVYGADGNLGERLGDLIDDRSDLACFRGLLAASTPDDDFAARVRAHDPALAGLDDPGLDLAAESYDAVVLAALAAAAAGTDSGDALVPAMEAASSGGVPCSDPRSCLGLVAGGSDLAYVGRTGPAELDGGDRTAATLTVVTFDTDGHLARTGTRRIGP